VPRLREGPDALSKREKEEFRLPQREAVRVVLLAMLGTCIYRAVEMDALKHGMNRGALFAFRHFLILGSQVIAGIYWMRYSPGNSHWGVLIAFLVILFMIPNY